MSNCQLLEDLLTSLGYPPVDDQPAAEKLGDYATSGPPYEGDHALFEPLRRRGWCIHFDAEGQFFQPGEHSRLIAVLLTLTGVESLPEIRDTWVVGAGWVLEIADETRRLAYHLPDPGCEFPSDYCELWLVKALVDDWLAPNWLLLDPTTGDQTAFCCMVPRPVYDELCEIGFIDRDREENFLPSSIELVLYPPSDVADYMDRVEKLSAQAADAMVSAQAKREQAGNC